MVQRLAAVRSNRRRRYRWRFNYCILSHGVRWSTGASTARFSGLETGHMVVAMWRWIDFQTSEIDGPYRFIHFRVIDSLLSTGCSAQKTRHPSPISPPALRKRSSVRQKGFRFRFSRKSPKTPNSRSLTSTKTSCHLQRAFVLNHPSTAMSEIAPEVVHPVAEDADEMSASSVAMELYSPM